MDIGVTISFPYFILTRPETMKTFLLSLTAVLACLSAPTQAASAVSAFSNASTVSTASFDADHLIMAKKKGKKKSHKKAK